MCMLYMRKSKGGFEITKNYAPFKDGCLKTPLF